MTRGGQLSAVGFQWRKTWIISCSRIGPPGGRTADSRSPTARSTVSRRTRSRIFGATLAISSPGWARAGRQRAIRFSVGIFAVTSTFPPATQQSALCQWLQYLLLVGRLGVFSAIFLLVGFGPGKREFESSMSIGPFTTSGKGDEVIKRVMFGGFGLLTGLGTRWHAISHPLQLLGIWHARRQG